MNIQDYAARVEAPLALLTDAEADALIGEATDEYRALLRGGEALAAMLWAMTKANGVRQDRRTLRMMAQGQALLLSLIHKAYALGVRRGLSA